MGLYPIILYCSVYLYAESESVKAYNEGPSLKTSISFKVVKEPIPPKPKVVHENQKTNFGCKDLKINLDVTLQFLLKTNLFVIACFFSYEDLPSVRLVGNLPFNVSIPLLLQWLEAISHRAGPFTFGRVPMSLVFQKEVADVSCLL